MTALRESDRAILASLAAESDPAGGIRAGNERGGLIDARTVSA